MLSAEDIKLKATSLEARYAERDGRWSAVSSVRGGRFHQVFPEHFDEQYPYPMVANQIDVAARDYAEMLAPLPALNTVSGNMTSDRAKKFAAKRGRIGATYWDASNLGMQMFQAADNMCTYGMAVFVVEPDKATWMPKIRRMDPMGCYPEFNFEGECVSMVKKFTMSLREVIAKFGEENARGLMRDEYGQKVSLETNIDLIRYADKDQYTIVTSRKGLTMSYVENVMGMCPYVVGVRPGPDMEIRGQFDDVLGVTAARAVMMRLVVEAAEKSVQAPIVVPDDLEDVTIGPDALMRTSNPAGVGRLNLNIDSSTFAEMGTLQQELLTGARFPGARQGTVNASVVTGRGVEALLGGYDSQIKAGQMVLQRALREVTRRCFAMDEAIWPGRKKTIKGVIEGAPFEDTYTPSVDIAGDFTCDVTYGFLAGLDPNRALVFLLQLEGAGAIDMATVQRHMPFDVDVNKLQQNIDAQKLRDALMQGVMAYVQAVGPLAEQGQDPSRILGVVAKAIKGRQDGKALEDLLSDAFEKIAEEEAAKAQEMQDAAAEAGAAPGGVPGAPGAMGPDGLQPGVAPGQAGMAPGGRPDLQMLLAKLGSNGEPGMSVGVRRQAAV